MTYRTEKRERERERVRIHVYEVNGIFKASYEKTTVWAVDKKIICLLFFVYEFSARIFLFIYFTRERESETEGHPATYISH